ncbi:MAG: bifunctional homocysteine S-methyltransferase/methylenetetrahydrofolate reductase [Planctomycetota bacterium]|nr:bifunctional homocysteine S-methyltransferase/methylenetetrahydrofolate reductase [Planctomycetota bacterium]MDA1112693.1 bifunctional homocysteine S-methyltransferase/methylenetetrahydrofolate reductase [Planctomycetota bacterium]
MKTSPNTRIPLRDALGQEVLLLDGAMGTELNQRGIPFHRNFETANLEHPDWVQEIHQSFLDAGSDALLTNTFGANRYRLAKHQLEDKLGELLEAGGRLARETAGQNAYVLGSLGPLGVELEPLGRVAKEEAQAAFAESAQYLLPFVDGFALETFDNVAELECAILGLRSVTDKPIFAFLAIGDNTRTSHGTTAKDSALRAEAAGADVVGFNCSSGPRVVLDAVLEASQGGVQIPLAAKPNAGMPRQVDGRIFYENDPDYFARFARRFLQAGGVVLGGCCGTTPDHIRALSRAARAGAAQMRGATRQPSVKPDAAVKAPDAGVDAIPLAERSRFAAGLARGRTVISVELVPPRTPDMTKLLHAARTLDRHGVDAVNLPDGPRASARISNIACAAILSRETNIEPLLHFCCRDRNLLGMQSDLLGAAALGLHNILAITGDPPYKGDYPDLTAVFDIDSIGLTNMITMLNRGLDLGGNDLGQQTRFCNGGAFNHTALDLNRELERLFWKIDAGSDYFITQPVFDADTLLEIIERLPAHTPPILAGLWPLRSRRNAEFLNSEVPGVHLPEKVLKRMAYAEDRNQSAEVGIEIALETVEALQGKVAGFQVAAPFNCIEPALQVVEAIHAGS